MEFFEKPKNNIESIVSLERLRDLSLTGNYLFHGTSEKIDSFEPRQAQNFNGQEMVNDDKPAVFASCEIHIPLFRSIFSPNNMDVDREANFTTRMEDYGDHVVTKANSEAIEQVRQKKGFVYVLPRDTFINRRGQEWISYDRVKPIAVYETSYADIEDQVVLIED